MRVSREEIVNYAVNTAIRYGLNPYFVVSLFWVESNLNPFAVNPKTKASGIGQLMPSTARAYGVKDVFDYRQNIDAACRLIRDLVDRHGDNIVEVLRRYGGFVSKEAMETKFFGYMQKVLTVWLSLLGAGRISFVLDESDIRWLLGDWYGWRK